MKRRLPARLSEPLFWNNLFLLQFFSIVLGLLVTAGGLNGCARSISPQSLSSQDGSPVTGVGGFGTQCALAGTRGDPKPVELTSFGCSTDPGPLELQQPLLPLIFQADCVKKQILVYSVDGVRLESRWDTLPDGKFFFTMAGGSIHLADDHQGHTSCQTPSSLEVAGLMTCRDRDHATIEIDATWHLNQNPPGNPSTTPNSGFSCSVPSDCCFHAFTTLYQCVI